MRARYSADIAGTIASITSAVSAGVGDAVVVSGVAAASIGTATGSTAGTAAVLPQLGHLTSHTFAPGGARVLIGQALDQ